MDDDIIVFILIICLFYIVSMINRFTVNDEPKTVRYIYPDELNTGDLMCVSYSNLTRDFIATFTKSCWVHVGIIWVDPNTNIRYVLEGAMYGKKYRNFFKINIDSWFNINKNSLICWKKYNGPSIDAKTMINSYTEIIEFSKLEGLNINWCRFFMNQKYQKAKYVKKLTCFEAVVILGQDIGIFDREKKYSSYFPSDLVNNKIKLCENISYNDAIEIKMAGPIQKLLFNDMENFPDKWKN